MTPPLPEAVLRGSRLVAAEAGLYDFWQVD